MPTFTATVPIIRWILLREKIDIVHAHQATSVLANESVAIGSAMQKATVYTDHSLFGFNDVASVILNRVSWARNYYVPPFYWIRLLIVNCLLPPIIRSYKPHCLPWMLPFVLAILVETI